MSKILITLLNKQSDILKVAHFANSLVKENPHSEIHLLTYEEFESATKQISNISKVHTIDREFITASKNNHLFSDAFAINSLFENLNECLETQWDMLINFSNDNVSAYLCSLIDAKETIGTTISKAGSPLTSNKWATYLNFVNSGRIDHVINNNQVRHHMANIPYHTEGKKIKVNEEYSSVASQNFSKIRKSKTTTSNTHIIGISLKPSYNGAEIDFHSLCEIIDSLESSDEYKTVLLLSGTEHEKNIANELNQKFDNSLISINTDDTAFSSVVINLDSLITTSNGHLLIADALETRTIEIIPQANAITAASSINAGNYLVFQTEMENIADDTNFILNQEFETNLPVSSINSLNKTYALVNDDYGILKTQIRGTLDIQSELRYHIERCYHYQLMGYPVNHELIHHIKENSHKEDLSYFVTQVKDELTDSVKILLATLRSLKGVKQSKNNLQSFISYLDTLITKGKMNSIASGAISLFEGNIENINTSNSDENIKAIESNLFELKNNFQVLTNILTELVTDTRKDKVSEVNG